jgi:hypothetical protein
MGMIGEGIGGGCLGLFVPATNCLKAVLRN